MNAHRSQGGERGFSLVELLVVVVIIGILAAIAIPAFMRQRESAWRATVESDLKNASLAIESEATRADNGYVFAAGEDQDSAVLASNGFNGSPDVEFSVAATDADFRITGHHLKVNTTPTTAVYDSTDGTITWS